MRGAGQCVRRRLSLGRADRLDEMETEKVRKTFLEFFAERGHTIVPSSSLVPDDPTLLLTNSGMVQFKPYFLGEKSPPYLRAATVQKCIRAGGKHNDLEEVGKTARHLTFFEMLGNFSFGDYFKLEACNWGWELLTEGFGLDPNRIWTTVFETDDEAARIWHEEVGVPQERILRRGKSENFWDMGVAGPCGPCSELLYDRGEGFGATYTGAGPIDDERYLEIWNLVFMQYIRDDRDEIVGELPKQNVDTGMGLERLAAILQDVPTAFEIDSMAPILRVAEQVIGKTYGEEAAIDVSLRVLAEHARAMTMLIADGVIPSNEERGYVLRRLIRRAARYARLAGVDEPVLRPLVDAAIELFGSVYPEVERNRDLVRSVVEREESRFDMTLRQGLGTLEEEIEKAKSRGDDRLSGAVAFRLHDTYGFPLDLTRDIASEEGLSLDFEEFEVLMTAQRERARAARPGLERPEEVAALQRALASVAKTEFLGYERLESDASVLALLRGLDETPVLTEGEEGELVLDRTSFYAEGGGQIGDRGEIRTETGIFTVDDCRWAVPGVIVHIGKVATGELRVGQEALATVDPVHREGVRPSHTATHMVHWALRNYLGEHARQQGSLVEPGRLRFDFSHYEPVARERLAGIEEEINRRVILDDPVRAFETTYDYAMSIGATALFGEKYGDYVRVVEVGDYSKELCGGTHVVHTGEVGVIKVVGESSVGAGLRRVEALTGPAGLNYLNTQEARLRQIAEMLRVEPERVVQQIERLLAAKRQLEEELGKQRAASEREEVRKILESKGAVVVNGWRLVAVRRDGRPVAELRRLAVALRDAVGSGVVIIGSAQDDAANLVAASTKDLLARGVSAAELLSEGAALLGGSAGGRPDLAVAGGPHSEELDRAMAAVEGAARRTLEVET
jgi:alanyl-tRNA synthetase